MPTIFTKAPAGIALTPYSTPRRRNENSVGPKPMKNRVTFMPNARAAAACPISCRVSDSRMPSAKSATPMP